MLGLRRTKPEALRGQNTAKAGRRPGVLTEPESQGGAVTVGYVAAPGPLLVVASLAGGDEVDATTVSYLLKAALVKKKEEEERKVQERKERLMQEIHRKVRADEAVTDAEWAAWKAWRGIGSSSSGGQKRKRKKRRKRKTPKTSSSRGRPHRRLWQWQCARLVFLVLFLALCSRRRYWQWYVLAGFAGYDTPRAVLFFPLINFPICSS